MSWLSGGKRSHWSQPKSSKDSNTGNENRYKRGKQRNKNEVKLINDLIINVLHVST